MNHLLDTHVLLWLLSTPERVPEAIREALSDRAAPLLVSAASGIEIATKIRLGKLRAPALVQTLPGRLASLGAQTLPITLEHALLAGSMTWAHRDPFDRLLVAQATIENATLVTVDQTIAALTAPRTLSW